MRPFVSRVPAAGGGTLDVRIMSLTYNDAKFWHQAIQPVIDRIPERLDRGWNWAYTPFWLALIETLRRREMVGYVVMVQAWGRAVPLGMVLLSAGYPALAYPSLSSVYVWYLAAAPGGSLTPWGVMTRPYLLETLIDIGMVESEASSLLNLFPD